MESVNSLTTALGVSSSKSSSSSGRTAAARTKKQSHQPSATAGWLVSCSYFYWMTLLLTQLLIPLKGGHAFVTSSTTKFASSNRAASKLHLHTKHALQSRSGGSAPNHHNSNGHTAGWSRLLLQRSLPAFWASSACLFQSSASSAEAVGVVELSTDSTKTAPSSAAGGTDNPNNSNNDHKLSETIILANAQDFVKPDPDLRQYRWIQLPNNLQVLLVSTTETTSKGAAGSPTTTSNDNTKDDSSASQVSHVEAAAVHVQAGHMDDPIPGLAHFHEHMLFLGTEKYPDESEYESFLSKYGGFSNAYTDMEDTNYYFSLTTTPNNNNTNNNSNQNLDSNDNQQQETCHAHVPTSEALEGSLDRLAQFFIAPTFESNMVDREVRAIDSEWRNARTSDSWRNYQLLKAAANPLHPFSKFGCGNYDTLTASNTTSPRPALLDFWKSYYQTYNLRLAVVGFASLDALQASVEKTFGPLPYSEGTPRRLPTNSNNQVFPQENAVYGGIPAFGKEQLGILRQVIPVMEGRVVKVMFATPPVVDPIARESKPHRILSHLLGHESPGSLHSLLNDLGYIQSLSSGMGITASDFSLFSISLALTPKGMLNKQHVLELVFQWIALIKQTILKAAEDDTSAELQRMHRYQEELGQMSQTNFKFRENGDPTDFCSTVAELMFDTVVPPHRILIGNSAEISDYDPKITQAFMERLQPANALVVEINSDLKLEQEKEAAEETKEANGSSSWQTEPWYGAQYRTETLSLEQMKAWESPPLIDARLKLPALNEYIPTDFSLKCDGGSNAVISETEREAPPQILVERPELRLWHKLDKYWRVPKAFIKLSLVSPNIYQSPRTMTYNRIYQRILNDDLKSTVYEAALAGCNYRVSCTPTAIRISVQGYSEKLSFLLNTLTSRMLSLIDEMKQGPEAYPALAEKFDKAKQNLLRETNNYRLDTPYEVASYNSRLILEESVWYLEDYVNEMEGERYPLTMQECAHVAEECLTARKSAEAMCMGNIDATGAQEALQVIDDHFFKQSKSRPLSEAEVPTFRSLKLPTWEEAVPIFGTELANVNRTVPLVYQELAFTASEENNAIEYIIQTGSELELGYEGLAMLELIAHISYNSAFGQLRTKEQLGYIVSTFPRKTSGGGWGLSTVVQSSVAIPEILEQRVEAWLLQFRSEVLAMEPHALAMEAAAVVSQLKERDTKLSQEVNQFWGEIVNTATYSHRLREPAFDRLDRLADELTVVDNDGESASTKTTTTLNGNDRKTAEQLKQRVLDFMDTYISSSSPSRRAMSARVYNQKSKAAFDANLGQPGVLTTFEDIRHVKQFLSSWPLAPYWRPQPQDKLSASASSSETANPR